MANSDLYSGIEQAATPAVSFAQKGDIGLILSIHTIRKVS